MCVEIYAGCFAVSLTFAAVLALVCIDGHLEERVSADKSEQRSDGTNGVAPSASVLPSQYRDDAPSQQSDDKSRDAFKPDINLVERITAEVFCERRESIVCELVERSKDG